jgi:DNA-binding NarL/FixJ family response regulator
VTKTSPPEALVRAIFDVFAGRIALSPDIDHELALSRLGHERIATEDLTPREFEVLRLLLGEKTTAEIAATLNISPRTVANHHSLIKSKLGVSSDIELVRLALRQRILEERDSC